jgi:hypothetical protein
MLDIAKGGTPRSYWEGHIIHARAHAEEAVKAHTAEHGKK